MGTKLLDTTFLIHYWGGRDDIEAHLDAHDESEFLTTTLNIKELAVGRYLQGEFSRSEILSTFEWVEIRSFNTEPAFLATDFEASLQRDEDVNQDKVNAVLGDLLIASVARDVGATVVTKNVDDFEDFVDVAVESY